MKKILVLAVLSQPLFVIAQSGVFGKVKQKVKARVEQRTDETIDKTLNKTEDEILTNANPQNNEQKEVAPISEKTTGSMLKSYSKYDFIAGERIVYIEDFSNDEPGELPLKWITNNRGETVTVESIDGKWMRLFPGSHFASPSFTTLPENFTFEADILMQFGSEGGYVYPELEIKLLQLQPGNKSPNSYVTNQDADNEVSLVLLPGGADKPLNAALKSYVSGRDYFSNQIKELKTPAENGKILHLSVWVQKERIRYWINGEKIFDIPTAVPAKSAFNRIGFSIESSLYNEGQLGYFVSNIKSAEGTPDMRSKLLTEGKLVTNSILFDVASDRIKPESTGVLKEIAAVLKENPAVNIRIVGHTDSDGDDAKNLDLSKRRSISVQSFLVKEYGIDGKRIQTDGVGESKPLVPNNTKEDKAKNRRVEFVKL